MRASHEKDRPRPNDPQLIWAAHYLSALAKALLDDAELGMPH